METKTRIDFISLLLYLFIACIGIASVYSATSEQGAFTLLEGRSGRQLMWYGVSVFLAIVIFLLNSEFFEVFSWYFYIGLMLLLVAVLFVGAEIAGSRSWLKIGSFSLQPAEFAKYGTAFAIAAFLSHIDVSLSKRKDLLTAGAIIGIPAVLIILQGDAGSALVFSSFILVLYREGLTPLVLVLGLTAILIFVLTMVIGTGILAGIVLAILGVFLSFTYTNKKIILPSIIAAVACIAFSFSVQYIFSEVLQEHQQKRIQVTLNLLEDPQGAGYNVNQAKIAIGSGGFNGKGFLKGSHTKGDFIPEQTTDFIFCTIGEEGGWLWSAGTILLFTLLILRLYWLAHRAKKKYKRVFIFSVASIIFFHLTVNIGMTIGLMPVIGIPLPLISYGGSSILAFSLLIFTALRFDASRDEDLQSVFS
ncbi:rod shape-determining protein RodA [bacterium]|nr:rod shape-determining protein RodA [bacterium]